MGAAEAARAREHEPARPREPARMRLGVTAGRHRSVRGPGDLARAIHVVDRLCAHNGVKRDAVLQRVHERPGLKRKRLVSERWRTSFKASFREMVGKVKKLRSKGW